MSPSDPLPPLRSHMEIQRAHDILVQILLKEVPNPLKGPNDELLLVAVTDALCWVLNHDCGDHGAGFAKTLADIEASLKAKGFVLGRLPQGNG